ncbi:MAG: LamG domain-containing protein [Sedimentisphaerales bacterium]|nr:LamG domain-containing protein [Sedimentisphaerales bacterium]
MFKKLICLISLILLLSLAGNAVAEIVMHWSLDDGSGTTASDMSGNGHNGTIGGAVSFVAGKSGMALDFNGSSTYIDLNDQIVNGTWSLAMWLKPRDIPYSSGFYAVMHTDSWAAGTPHVHLRASTSLFNVDTNSGPNLSSTTALEADEWYHCAYSVLHEGGANSAKLYVNGVMEAEGEGGTVSSAFGPCNFGAWNTNDRFYHGLMDEIRVYDHELAENEILSAMEGEPWPYAFGPDPANGAIHAATWVTLSWKPGQLAVSHDVYFGDSYDSVNEGTGDTFRGNQASTYYVAGFPGFAYPEGLVPGTTYYWRIDEVNNDNPESPWKGDVWSFSVPPKTAYNPVPADGAEFVGPDAVTMSWTSGYGAILHTVYKGDDYDEVNNAVGGAPTGTTTYNPGPLEREKVYYWRVDEFDAVNTHKGNIWSFTTPGAVGNPQPAYDATDVGMNATLSWTAADSAASHELYFGTDKEAVRTADASSAEYKGSKTLGAESHDPGLLEAGTNYYWRVDEVDAQGNVAKGPLWVFTTGAFLLVDDFESYTDDDVAGEAIWQTWIDGYGVADNGAQVGYLVPPYAEQTIVHSGLQSMPLLYVNEAGVTNSEATMTLTAPRDWTQAGVTELSLWFRGVSTNAADPMYVSVSNSAGSPAIVSHEDASAATATKWTQWIIPLQSFADQGVNLTNVDTIAIGLGSKGGTIVGGSGTMYIDDIRLRQ